MTQDEFATALAASLLRHRGPLEEFLKTELSIVVRRDDGQIKDIVDFAKQKREPVRVFNRARLSDTFDPNLAAFRGVLGFVIEVGTKHYTLAVETAPRHAVSPNDLTELIEAQSPKIASGAWASIEEHFSRNLELNNETPIPRGSVRDFIAKPENLAFFDRMVGDALNELQIDVVAAGSELQIPRLLQSKLWRAPESHDFDKPVVEFKWDQKIRGADIVDLIDPQKEAGAIWERFDEALAPIAEAKDVSAPVDWRKLFLELSDEEATEVFGFVAGVLNGGFGHKGFQISIPTNLKSLFEPRTIVFENPRDEIRSNLQGKLWMPESNKEYWERTVMQEVPRTQTNALTLAAARTALEASLREGLAYAKEVESAFAQSLEEAIGGLSSQEPSLLVGRSQGEPVNILDLLEPQLSRRQLLNCVSLMTGLFGGMGTWNDQPPAEDPKRFNRITNNMINARQDAFAAAVSDEGV